MDKNNNINGFKVVSLFSWCGWLDLWFEKAGFNVVWANEYDKTIWETYEKNHKNTFLDKRSICDIPSEDIPEADWIIWWPPCQSWSEAWAGRWINDHRWRLFHEFIRVLNDKQPKFFLAENVAWILAPKHRDAVENIIKEFKNAWYEVKMQMLNAHDYWMPQDRKRVFFVWIRKDIKSTFSFPKAIQEKVFLKDAIWDLPEATPALEKNKANHKLEIPNHEYMIWGFSTMYMSRNRVRSWDEPSFTIQAWGRHAPIHPKAPKMKFIEQNKRIFVPGCEKSYRRLSLRECARVQTFPDNFIFHYTSIADGYKMVGNAVPVEFWYVLWASILSCLINEYTEIKVQKIELVSTPQYSLQPV